MPPNVDERDIRDLADLHVACLSDSVVGALGPSYVRSFYRYVMRSRQEIGLVERNHAGRIVAAAVLSLEPASLNRRLLLHTSLLPSFLTKAPRMIRVLAFPAVRPGHASADQTRVPAEMPELILMYASADARGRGLGSALIRRAEQRLRQVGVTEYQVRTVADSSNPALGFYRSRAFVPAGTSFKQGRFFQVLTKTLDPDDTMTNAANR